QVSSWNYRRDLSGLFSDPKLIAGDREKKHKQRANTTAADLRRQPVSSGYSRVLVTPRIFGFRRAPCFFLVGFERRLRSPGFRLILGSSWPALLLGLCRLAGSEAFKVLAYFLGALVPLRRNRS